MKIIAFLFLLYFTNPESDIISNDVVDISGLVVEEATGEPLIGAVVKIQGIEKKFYTDFDGQFNINALKPGTYDIEVSYISYQEKKLTEIQLNHHNNTLFVSLK
jgi:hypothetical protein